MLYQNINSDLVVDLSTVEQQLLAGGRCRQRGYSNQGSSSPQSYSRCGMYPQMDDSVSGSSPTGVGDSYGDESAGYRGGCRKGYRG